MTDEKYTNEDIVSSLKVIATTGNCDECKIRNCKWGTCNCSQITANAALDLINRQKAEIERLKKNIDGLNIFTKNHIKVIRLQAIKEFEEELEYFILNEDVEIVKPKCKYYGSYINGANQFRHQIKNGIKKLVKEMEVSE